MGWTISLLPPQDHSVLREGGLHLQQGVSFSFLALNLVSGGEINACAKTATKGYSALGQGWIGDPSVPGELEGIGTTIGPTISCSWLHTGEETCTEGGRYACR